ncbi:MAG: NADH-quinone oxidoreductase subunit NuoG [Pseudomonadota bacterium]
MSDTPANEDLVEITVDGKTLQARKGAMLIEATDNAGIDVPRFCYHKKLSVAANCRMCLVDVEKAPKPLPACATPIMPGMVVHTRSQRALDAQKSTMEFLLINHPLDCPICDQGGECELQDQAMGYGAGISQYTETKRVVMDKPVGPLISTELTRCIHCTRCVRFGEEIAGIRELGMTGRGENSRIGTFIKKNIDSELSGNVIDLCPVGALTARPSRYTARPWELTQHASIAPHDCIGSNIFIHARRGQAMRVVPRDNESINETWISDRDRFSYEAIHAKSRLLSPMLKQNGEWKTVGWEEALKTASDAMRAAGADLRTLVSPIATVEEQFLAQKLTRAMGSNSIDHRLRQRDFSAQEGAPVMPWLGMGIDDLENLDAALLVVCNPRKEQPIAAHRLRKAALKGARISILNVNESPQHFDTPVNLAVGTENVLPELLAIGNLVGADVSNIDGVSAAEVCDDLKAIADDLRSGQKTAILLGSSAVTHSHYAALQSAAKAIAAATGATLGYLAEAGNTAGAWLTGCVPHRNAGGQPVSEAGHNAQKIISGSKTVFTLGIDPDADCLSDSGAALGNADSVIALTSYDSNALRDCADVMLPIGTFAETSGTFVNASGMWQSFKGAISAVGESRPAWKVLRVLGNHLNVENCSYLSSEDVRNEVKELCRNLELNNMQSSDSVSVSGDAQIDVTGMYAVDALTRRATALQKTAEAKSAAEVAS